jgi:hypothetical protein
MSGGLFFDRFALSQSHPEKNACFLIADAEHNLFFGSGSSNCNTLLTTHPNINHDALPLLLNFCMLCSDPTAVATFVSASTLLAARFCHF